MSTTGSNDERFAELSGKDREEASPVWDMSQERMFLETLLTQRFNFFLVFFGFVLAAAINARAQLHLQIVLSLGAFVSFLFAEVLRRSQKKLDLVLDRLFDNPSHPAKIIDNLAGSKGSRRRFIGLWIPLVCWVTLLLGAIAAWSGRFPAAVASQVAAQHLT